MTNPQQPKKSRLKKMLQRKKELNKTD